MRAITVAAALVTLALAGPVFATDGGNGNVEQQTQPVPNRGNTSGGPAHDVKKAQTDAARTGQASDNGVGRNSNPNGPLVSGR